MSERQQEAGPASSATASKSSAAKPKAIFNPYAKKKSAAPPVSAPAPATSNHRANNTVRTNGAGINPYIKHNLNRPQKTTQNQPQKRRQLPPVNEATTFSQKHSAMKIPMPISGRKNALNNSLSMMLLHLLSPIAAPSRMAIPRTVSPCEIITQCCNLTSATCCEELLLPWRENGFGDSFERWNRG